MNLLWFMPTKWTASAGLLECREEIRDAIREESRQSFFRKIQELYPDLEELGVKMPAVRPFYFDSEWCRLYHVVLL